MSSSFLPQVSEISQYINLDRLREDGSELSFEHYIAYPSESEVPLECEVMLKHIFDISYGDEYETKHIHVCGFKDEEIGFIMKLTVPNSHIIRRRNTLTNT
jgi:hypothetical protein